MRTICPAKINLTLRILGKRPDGYHEIDSIVARVGLHDELSASPRRDSELRLTCDAPGVPVDESNLVLRAARKLMERAGRAPGGVDFALRKRIPAGAGLGGGSSNAAGALRLLNELWGLGWSRERLAEVGAEVGSDVPLFLHGPVCRIRGRGELVENLPWRAAGWVGLILPELHCGTREVYAAVRREAIPAGREWPWDAGARGGEVSAGGLAAFLHNDLREAAFAATPGLADVHERLERLGGGPVALTGSGSGLFQLFDEREAASGFAEAARALKLRAEVVGFERL